MMSEWWMTCRHLRSFDSTYNSDTKERPVSGACRYPAGILTSFRGMQVPCRYPDQYQGMKVPCRYPHKYQGMKVPCRYPHKYQGMKVPCRYPHKHQGYAACRYLADILTSVRDTYIPYRHHGQGQAVRGTQKLAYSVFFNLKFCKIPHTGSFWLHRMSHREGYSFTQRCCPRLLRAFLTFAWS